MLGNGALFKETKKKAKTGYAFFYLFDLYVFIYLSFRRVRSVHNVLDALADLSEVRLHWQM